MHDYKPDKMKPLEGEDRVRMGRLFEEITGRVQEMAAIMNRLHGTSLNWTRFEIGPAPSGDASGDIPVIVVVCNPETGDCGCHDPEAGTCGPCPDVDL